MTKKIEILNGRKATVVFGWKSRLNPFRGRAAFKAALLETHSLIYWPTLRTTSLTSFTILCARGRKRRRIHWGQFFKENGDEMSAVTAKTLLVATRSTDYGNHIRSPINVGLSHQPAALRLDFGCVNFPDVRSLKPNWSLLCAWRNEVLTSLSESLCHEDSGRPTLDVRRTQKRPSSWAGAKVAHVADAARGSHTAAAPTQTLE
jgi:hypothetical protein